MFFHSAWVQLPRHRLIRNLTLTFTLKAKGLLFNNKKRQRKHRTRESSTNATHALAAPVKFSSCGIVVIFFFCWRRLRKVTLIDTTGILRFVRFFFEYEVWLLFFIIIIIYTCIWCDFVRWLGCYVNKEIGQIWIMCCNWSKITK